MNSSQNLTGRATSLELKIHRSIDAEKKETESESPEPMEDFVVSHEKYCYIMGKLNEVSARKPTDTTSLSRALEERRAALHTLLGEIRAGVDKLCSSLESDISALAADNRSWLKKQDEACRLYRTLSETYQAGKTEEFAANYGRAISLTQTVLSERPVPSLLDLGVLQTEIHKVSLEIQRRVNAKSADGEKSSSADKVKSKDTEEPWIHIVEASSKLPVLSLYNIETGIRRRVELANLPANLNCFDSAQLCNTVYIVGGYTASRVLSSVFSYLLSSRFSGVNQRPDMLFPRYNHTLCASPARTLIAIGGCSCDSHGTAKDLDTCEQFDPGSGRWTELPRLSEPKHSAAVCLFDSRYIYAFGGASVSRGTLGSVEVLDILAEKGEWLRLPISSSDTTQQELMTRRCAAAIQLDQTHIMIFGGYKSASLGSVVRYNTATAQCEEEVHRLPQISSFQQRKPVRHAEEIYLPDYYYGNVNIFGLKKGDWRVVTKYNWTSADFMEKI